MYTYRSIENILNKKHFFKFLLLLFAGACIFVVYKLVLNNPEIGWDFRVIWIAGSMWLDGANPYQFSLFEKYNVFDPKGYEHLWVYPPNWSFLSIILSLLPFRLSLLLWNIISVALLIFMLIHLVNVYTAKLKKNERSCIIVVALIAVFVSQSLSVNIWLGQTATIISAAVLMLLHGTNKKSTTWITFGTILLALKPTFALILVPMCFVLHLRYMSILYAVGITLLMSLPAIFISGLSETIFGFLRGISLYGNFRVNAPPELTGLIHLHYLWTGKILNSIVLVFLGSAFGVLCIYFNRRFFLKEDNYYLLVFLSLAIIFLFVPMHSYDWLISLPFILLCLRLPSYYNIVAGVLFLIVSQSSKVENILNLASNETITFKDTTLLSYVGLFSFILICIYKMKEKVRY